MKRTLQNLRVHLVDLPTVLKLVLTVLLVVPGIALVLVTASISLDALRLVEIANVLPQLPDRGVELLEFFRMGQAQSTYIFWLCRTLGWGAIAGAVVLGAMWWPRQISSPAKPEGATGAGS